LIEGMAIAGIGWARQKGYIYIRSEYPHAVHSMTKAIETAQRAGLLGARSREQVRI